MNLRNRHVTPLSCVPWLLAFALGCGNQVTFSGAARPPQSQSTDAQAVSEAPFVTVTSTSIETAPETEEIANSPIDEVEPAPAEVPEPQVGEEPDEVVAPTPTPTPSLPPPPPPPPTPVTFSQTFKAARVEDLSIAVDPPNRYASQILTLREAAPAVTNLMQMNRGIQEELFTQGHDGDLMPPETFTLTRAGLLDLLVIVDDSNSMRNEHEKLSTKLSSLLSSIGNTDWQIRVITTSDPCPRNNRLIRAGDQDAAQAFENAVKVPIIPWVIEKGLPMGIRGLKGECKGQTTPWLRDGSAVALLILSDEENCSSPNGDGCRGEVGDDPMDMINYLASIRPAGKARFYGIIEGPGNPCGDEAYEATEYRAVVEATGGTYGTICDPDYGATLRMISANVSRIIDRRFDLTSLPDMGTLMLEIDGKPISSGFRTEGKTLILEPDTVQESDRQLFVSYRTGATPKFDRITLAQGADPHSIRVKVGNDVLASDEFTFDAATRELDFDAIPADDAVVRVSYRVGGLPKRFELNGVDILGSPLAVTVDGQRATYRFDPAGPAIEFAMAPSDGQRIIITHRTASGRVTHYPTAFADLQLIPVAEDTQTGDQIPIMLRGTDLVVDADEVVEGRRLRVRFDLGDTPQELVYDLGHEPEPGTVRVRDDNGQEVCDFQVNGSLVTLACKPSEADRFTLSYRHVAERFTTFTLPGSFAAERATWQVWVDGQPLSPVVRNDHTVIIPLDHLTIDSIVKVAVTYFP